MSKIKSLLVCLITIFSTNLVFLPQDVSAHVLLTDGSIGAVVHVDPEDDPIVGQKATFFFEFKDTKNKFQLEDCVCNAKVLNSGAEVFSEQLSHRGSSSSPSFTYTFSEKGVYKIVIQGTPNSERNFDSFELNYDLRVSRTSGSVKQLDFFTRNLQYFVLIAAVPIFLIIVFSPRKKITVTPEKPPKITALFLIILSTFLLHQTLVTPALASHHSGDNHQDHSCCTNPQLQLSETSSVGSPINTTFEKLSTVSASYEFITDNRANSRSPPILSF